MQKRNVVLFGILLAVGVIYLVFFTHWGEKRGIAISVSYRPSRHPGETSFPVVFSLDAPYQLTSVAVIPMQGKEFDPHAPPVWHLISDSNSVPMRALRYGQPIRGMKSELKGVRPEPLVPGTYYRVVLTADGLEGDKTFAAKAMY